MWRVLRLLGMVSVGFGFHLEKRLSFKRMVGEARFESFLLWESLFRSRLRGA